MRMASYLGSYEKLFILEIQKRTSGQTAVLEVARFLMKAHIMGVISGIKQFHQRTEFTVDDGTGALNCILWYKESSTSKDISQLQKDVRFGHTSLSTEVKDCALSLLKRAEMSHINDAQYMHGDVISCLGNVKVFRGKLQLEILHHSKSSDVNAETLWILDVLTTNQRKNKEI